MAVEPRREAAPRLSAVGIRLFAVIHEISTGSAAPVFELWEFDGVPSFRWGKSPKPVFQAWESRRSALARPTAGLRFGILPESKRRRFGNRRRHPGLIPLIPLRSRPWKLQAARISWDRSTPWWRIRAQS